MLAIIALTDTATRGTAIRGITQKHYSDYAVLRANYDENDPIVIENEYQLGHIPDGYVLYAYTTITTIVDNSYINPETNKTIGFTQFVKSHFNMYTDNEHCSFEIMDVDGKQELWVGKEKYGTIYLNRPDLCRQHKNHHLW